MRSFAEIRFRAVQEIANGRLFIAPPRVGSIAEPDRLPLLPCPETVARRLGDSDLARDIERRAASILEHRFPLLGYIIETGPQIRWRRDYVHGRESGLEYFRRIPYLDSGRVGDHKIIWELNRHQHLVLLAQAYLFRKQRLLISEICGQLESWWAQNPFARGINWASALEVAFRSLSWTWVYHLVGSEVPESVRSRLVGELFRHGVYLEHNLSVYFSPNTHLLGEAVALHALGVLFPDWPRSPRWRDIGAGIVAAQMDSQVRSDGSHFEQSTAYHIYAVDLFLFHALLAPVDEAYRNKLAQMCNYLACLSSETGHIPLLGDDDGGRLFHPYGDRRCFGAATLASANIFFDRDEWPCSEQDIAVQAAWWFGARAFRSRQAVGWNGEPRLFRPAGIAVLSGAPTHIVVDTRAFGVGVAGHSHSHALHFTCSHRGQDILIDPGSFTYVGEPEWRDRFRSVAAHNTIRIDGRDQATAAGPFRWVKKPKCELIDWSTDARSSYLRAACSYAGFRHERRWLWLYEAGVLAILDIVEGPSGVHDIEQFWHCAGDVTGTEVSGVYRIANHATLLLPPAIEAELVEGGDFGWQSEVPGKREPRPVLCARSHMLLPCFMAAVLHVEGETNSPLNFHATTDEFRMDVGPGRSIGFSRSGALPVFRWDLEDRAATHNDTLNEQTGA